MSDDFVSLKILIVSDVPRERDVLRLAASQASVPINLIESATQDPDEACDIITHDIFDAVFMDSRMPKIGRQRVLTTARGARGRPLVILIGAAEMKTREVLTDGLPVDGVLAKPINLGEARTLLAACVRARLPSRVLIVDDSGTVRQVVRKVLQASRFVLEPEEAEEGGAALALAAKQHFDVVFLDCAMPGLDGFQTLAELKRKHPDTKVVMISGTNNARITQQARAGGADEILFKPFYSNDIDGVLNRLYGLMRPKPI
jgi:CheY-like chemotaxis protein